MQIWIHDKDMRKVCALNNNVPGMLPILTVSGILTLNTQPAHSISQFLRLSMGNCMKM